MAEELAFARKASGLVRGLSMRDCLGMGIAFIAPLYSIWFIEQVGLGLYPKANVPLAILISVATVGWAAPVVWGILGSTMPRSGGEYVYNSRIIHPAIAMGASFAMIAAGFYWAIFNASMFASPSLAMLGQYMGWTGLADFVGTNAGAFTLSVVAMLGGLLLVIFGMNVFHKLAWIAIAVMCGGVAILDIALTFTSKADFISNWNAQAAEHGSLTYDVFLAAAGTAAGGPMPTSWTWSDTLGITAGVYMIFVWTFALNYIGGEVKRPDKVMIKAHILSRHPRGALPVGFHRPWQRHGLRLPARGRLPGLQRDGRGIHPALSAARHVARLRGVGSESHHRAGRLPHVRDHHGLACGVELIVIQRGMFAWGMDRMGPKWFTSINARTASPIGMYLFAAAISIFLIAGYWYLFPSVLTGVVAGGMQVCSASS